MQKPGSEIESERDVATGWVFSLSLLLLFSEDRRCWSIVDTLSKHNVFCSVAVRPVPSLCCAAAVGMVGKSPLYVLTPTPPVVFGQLHVPITNPGPCPHPPPHPLVRCPNLPHVSWTKARATEGNLIFIIPWTFHLSAHARCSSH